ncbi:SdpI family protein [Paenibacillus sp. RS8]|uniref:SdpI family protein n=1 Tax=unclassified Paenibacillus TaxID=185978 RepID=UPI0005AA47B3|nr:SdpI family protein [Paenibacillus sp. FSL R5-0345]
MKDFKWRWQDTLIVILGLASLSYALINYGKLPQELPAQWGITGKVNRYWDKSIAIPLWGILGIVLPLIMQFTRSIDPKRENYKKFENAYAMSRLAIGVLFNLMLVLTVTYGLGKDINVGKIAIGAVGVMFIALGNYMPQVKDNYLFGVRTAWTLSSPEVWRKTHRLSGRMWMVGGLLIFGGAFLSGVLSQALIIAALVLAIIVPVLYSWIISRQLKS